MSKLEELIKQLCQNGVEYKTLGELGKFYGGITGKSKEDFKDGNAKFITYKNVYENISLKLDVEDKVKISEKENQRTLEYGDIIFTGSSETPDECGISSVITKKVEEKLYLNSFCFFFRMNNKEILNPDFAKHLFRSSNLRYQIGKTASGVTRFNVSKKAMEKICIPVPPLEVQCEIVHILDDFTLLSAELSAELKARQQQYEYYKNELYSFKDKDVKYVKLKEIAEIYRGGNFQKKDFIENGKPCIHYGQIYTKYGKTANKTYTFVNDTVFEKSKQAGKNDIVMAVTSENIEDVCKCVVWLGNENIAVSGHTAIIHTKINARYLGYYFSTLHFFIDKAKLAHGTKVIEVTPSSLNDILIPVPSEEEQENIASKVEKFEKLCNDISEGLPAEIEARQKQYEYYRDKLLTFKELKVNE